MNFRMNHAPGAGPTIRTIYLQYSILTIVMPLLALSLFTEFHILFAVRALWIWADFSLTFVNIVDSYLVCRVCGRVLRRGIMDQRLRTES